MQSLYIHFPFCETKCHYCDFYSLARSRVSDQDVDRFERALQKEFKLVHSMLNPSLETIFMGGGTPSLTEPDRMETAMAPFAPTAAEWTMEANPSSITREKVEAYRKLGVNRISLGVQSLHEPTLKAMGRVHNSMDVIKAIDAILEGGIKNFSVDYLCGVPGLDETRMRSELETLSRLPITHLSCYLLTLPTNHWMASRLPNEETQLAHLLTANEVLTQNGFEQYEISNYCRSGLRAQHNMNYWNRKSYLGVGPSAHAYDARTETRWKNFSSLKKYAEDLESERLPIEWKENLTPEQIEMEKWLLGLRLSDGFPVSWLETGDQRLWAEKLQDQNLLEPHPDHPKTLRPTPRGFALSDQIIQKFVQNAP